MDGFRKAAICELYKKNQHQKTYNYLKINDLIFNKQMEIY